jgi:hypothetical protein
MKLWKSPPHWAARAGAAKATIVRPSASASVERMNLVMGRRSLSE